MCILALLVVLICLCFFFFNDTATTEIYTYLHTLSLHDALPIWPLAPSEGSAGASGMAPASLDRCRAVPGDDRHGLPGDRADQEGQAAIRQRALGRKLINGAFEAPKWRTYRAEMRAAKVGHLCKRISVRD